MNAGDTDSLYDVITVLRCLYLKDNKPVIAEFSCCVKIQYLHRIYRKLKNFSRLGKCPCIGFVLVFDRFCLGFVLSWFCHCPGFVPVQVLSLFKFFPVQVLSLSRFCPCPGFVPVQVLYLSRFCPCPYFVPV